MEMTSLRVLIVGGGTGGHISPGIALYEALKKKKADVVFLVSKNDLRFSYIKTLGDDLLLYGAPPFTKNIFKLPFFVLRFLFAYLKSKRILKRRGINTVVGMGGYVSAPMLLAAKRRRIAISLCEQNSVPGRVTRLFSKYAENIFSTFESTRDNLKYNEKYVYAGNPIRDNVFVQVSRDDAKEFFNLRHCSKVILAIGGSQGALKINQLVFGIKKVFPNEFKDVGIIWSTGDFSHAEYKKKVQEEIAEGSIFLSPFINDVGYAYRACDIAISRSGAGVMMELAAMGVPSILIPYPFAADDHQSKNADEFVAKGAALKISNEDATPERVGPVLIDLLESRLKLEKMSEYAFAAAKRNAGDDIAEKICRDFGFTAPAAQKESISEAEQTDRV